MDRVNLFRLPDRAAALRHLGLAIGYGLAFFCAHQIAVLWGGSYFFSLFYPAAGIRFALLWRFGARYTPVVVLVELFVQSMSGVIQFGGTDTIDQIVSVARTPSAYGIAIGLVRWIARRGGAGIATPPMPFALATVLAPIAASLASLAWLVIAPVYSVNPSREPAVTTAMSFMVGDLLGVLILAPALLALLSGVSGTPRPKASEAFPHPGEALIVYAGGWTLALAARQVDIGLMLTPVMLVTAWIGLRCGRIMAWLALVVAAVITLPISATAMDVATRLELHVGLAAVAVAGYLAGSYSEAQQRAQHEIAWRDRMLYQAERLKTLRAMSVAVIHEVSQPLSTLTIESRYMAELAQDGAANAAEIANIAGLLERKVRTLADMVRRLRRFGGRAIDDPSPIAVSSLLDDMAAIVRTEAQKDDVQLCIGEAPRDLAVMGQDIELTQALVNLVRNAVAAAPGGQVTVAAEAERDRAVIGITNTAAAAPRPYPGMGVGALVARAIVEAHGGKIVRDETSDGAIRHRLFLPIVGLGNG